MQRVWLFRAPNSQVPTRDDSPTCSDQGQSLLRQLYRKFINLMQWKATFNDGSSKVKGTRNNRASSHCINVERHHSDMMFTNFILAEGGA